ncbi:MAG: transposase [Deltaproteobacteria bacterium]|nr:transposase [Deltaproteobacteria bacterium]
MLELLESEGLLGEDVDIPEDDTAQLALVEAGPTGRSTLGEGATRVRGAEPRTSGSDRGRRHAWAEYFDLHANVRSSAQDRPALERRCRYFARPPLSKRRLRELPEGRLSLALKRAWDDGTTAIVLTPLQLLERLAAIIPHPRHNLVVYHGVLAARHRWRSLVVPSPVTNGQWSKWIPWADLLKRSFGIDALLCPVCGGRRQLRALVRTHEVSARLLGVLGGPWRPQQLTYRPAPRRQAEDWDGG